MVHLCALRDAKLSLTKATGGIQSLGHGFEEGASVGGKCVTTQRQCTYDPGRRWGHRHNITVPFRSLPSLH